jgi:hypothetical protein
MPAVNLFRSVRRLIYNTEHDLKKVWSMLNTAWAVVREGKIEVLEQVDLPEGARVLVTVLSEDDTQFWLNASQTALARVWGNTEDDVYAQLLEK